MTQKKKATKKTTKAPEKKKRAPVGERPTASVVSVEPRQEAPEVEATAGEVKDAAGDFAAILGPFVSHTHQFVVIDDPGPVTIRGTLLSESLPFLEELLRQPLPQEHRLRIRALMDRIEAEVGET